MPDHFRLVAYTSAAAREYSGHRRPDRVARHTLSWRLCERDLKLVSSRVIGDSNCWSVPVSGYINSNSYDGTVGSVLKFSIDSIPRRNDIRDPVSGVLDAVAAEAIR